MPITTPPHPGDLINSEIFKPFGLSATAAAVALGVHHETVSNLLDGKASLTPEMALRIEKAFGPRMEHLLNMQLAYDIAYLRSRIDDIKVTKYVPS